MQHAADRWNLKRLGRAQSSDHYRLWLRPGMTRHDGHDQPRHLPFRLPVHIGTYRPFLATRSGMCASSVTFAGVIKLAAKCLARDVEAKAWLRGYVTDIRGAR